METIERYTKCDLSSPKTKGKEEMMEENLIN